MDIFFFLVEAEDPDLNLDPLLTSTSNEVAAFGDDIFLFPLLVVKKTLKLYRFKVFLPLTIHRFQKLFGCGLSSV